MKLILGLVWMLIQKYHIQAEDARRAMLDWIQVQYVVLCLISFSSASSNALLYILVFSFVRIPLCSVKSSVNNDEKPKIN